MIWFGAALTLLGLFGIVYALVQIIRAKRANLSDEDMRARLGKIVPINLAAFFLSAIGLMVVIVGIVLA